jgi:hypothetical protein
MPKDHRLTTGRYGSKRRQLTRDDFAGVLYTLLPAEPTAQERAQPTSGIPRDVLDAARKHCAALAAAWPEEPIATLADTVAGLLADSPDPGAGVLYAAALLCGEEAERTGATGDGNLTPGSAHWASARLKSAAADTDVTTDIGLATESAFDQ